MSDNAAVSMLQSLFAQKAWANAELFAALAALPPETPADTVHGAVRMLNHIHVVDRIFCAHLLGEPHAYTATNTPETPALDALAFDVAETDGWYQQHVATLRPDQLAEPLRFRFTDGDPGLMSRHEVLIHVAVHGMYHRGNVGQMLKAIGVAPPRDLYTKFLHQQQPVRRQQ